ncbi:hypothetical protein [Thermoanaerobacterium thermosaccharolyticum]|uniref:hypothetical protein n=1 Tax=Thermoanaerobacterium thermosaccharolyticum TaxID=1517 RepID=UPI00178076AD|nr:hypothetical protein [Thermoanaerobacterium thermosaccharolyticum]MBE0067613.1 hypothetical protein [Thermoanaerobacterium thermosaccharolyticum]MBE0227197.1 hypothetical protein [Thermoanaerobacterium thermosaccharolyticum]
MPLRKDIYKRMYIMLEPDERGASLLKDKEITGYLKIETISGRGRITASLQNLDPSYSYTVKFLKIGENPKLIEFGAVRVDDKGRGGAEWSFDTDDVLGSGVKLDDLAVAFVEADNGNKLIPLSSVIDKTRFNWKATYKKLMKNSENNEKNKEQIYYDEEKGNDKTKKDENNIDALSESYTEKTQEDEVEIQVESEENDVGNQPVNSFEAEDASNTNSESEEKVIDEPTQDVKKSDGYEVNGNEENSGYVKYLKEYVNNIVNYLDEVHPFENNLDGYRWWKINTGYRNGFYDHYLIGFVNDENGKLKYIVYGMPGLFTLSDQPFGGMTGFVYWCPLKENMRNAGDMGYWLMHIDAATGQIAIPKGPTPPPII